MSNLPSLFNLTDELAHLLVSEEDVTERIEQLFPLVEHKAAAVAHGSKYLAGLVALLKQREEDVKEERKRLEKRAEGLEAYILKCLQQAEIYRITDSRTGTEIALKKNPPKVIVDATDSIPNELWRVPDPPAPVPDLKAIGERLKRGEDVAGCHLEQGWRVEIKG